MSGEGEEVKLCSHTEPPNFEEDKDGEMYAPAVCDECFKLVLQGNGSLYYCMDCEYTQCQECYTKVTLHNRRAVKPQSHGIQPVVRCKKFPPGGIYFAMLLAILSTFTHLKNALTFFKSHDYFFAVIVLLTTCLGSYGAMQMLFWQCTAKYGQSFREMVNVSVVSGIMTEELRFIFFCKEIFGFPIGFVATYGFILKNDLSLLNSMSAIMGFAFAAKDIASQVKQLMLLKDTGTKAGVARPLVIQETFPQLCKVISVFVYFQAFAEIAIFTVCCRVLHPALVWVIYLLGAFVCMWANSDESATSTLVGTCLGTADFAIMFPHQFIFAFTPVRALDDLGKPRRQIAVVVFTFVRFACLILISCTAELENGIANLGEMSREMGASVWQSDFVEPTMMLLQGKFDSTTNMTLGSSIYKSILYLTLVACGPIYLFMLAGLTVHSKFEKDEQVSKEVYIKSREVTAWTLERMKAGGLAYLLGQ